MAENLGVHAESYPVKRFVDYVESHLDGEPTLENWHRRILLGFVEPSELNLGLISEVELQQGIAGGVIPVEQSGRPRSFMWTIRMLSPIAGGDALFELTHCDGDDEVNVDVQGDNKTIDETEDITIVNAILDKLEKLESENLLAPVG